MDKFKWLFYGAIATFFFPGLWAHVTQFLADHGVTLPF